MAEWRKRLPENVEGEFFVDSTCIDCDTCRQLAPEVFAESGVYSFVQTQPDNPQQRREALRALISCPTASIGTRHKSDARAVVSDFPLPLEGGVSYCGFNSPKSFGGNSYFVEHPEGNWLVDSPRYVEHLVRQFEARGGIRFVFLTHRDDVADAAKYTRRFGSRRIIHRLELSAQPDAEHIIDSMKPVVLAPEFLAIPTPGHTRGHCVLLYRNLFLFTGDHLWWSRARGRLNASRSVCWHSWPQQQASMKALGEFTFEWVLPGHGQQAHLSRHEMSCQLETLVREMEVAA